MRITSGSVSAYFQQVHLGVGQGLGGLVAERAAPGTRPAGYLTDDRFLHTAPIDRAVREEGLVAILGVPLLLGKSVIGVLFAADRRTRNFGLEQRFRCCVRWPHMLRLPSMQPTCLTRPGRRWLS